METHKPVCVLFLPEPVVLRAVDAINVPIDLVVGVGTTQKKLIHVATISSDSPIGRPTPVVGARYTRTLVDGEIVARRGELLTDRSLIWNWPAEGKERRGSFMDAHVNAVDADLEQKLIASNGAVDALRALCNIPENTSVWVETSPSVDIHELGQTVEEALRGIGFTGTVEASIAPDGIVRVSASPEAHEPFGVAVHPASPIRNDPLFSTNVVKRMVAKHRWIFGPDKAPVINRVAEE